MEGSRIFFLPFFLVVLFYVLATTAEVHVFNGDNGLSISLPRGTDHIGKWNDTSSAAVNILGDDDDRECSYYHKLNHSEQCAFIRNNSDCHIDDGFINYLEFVFCRFPKQLIPLAFVFLFIWLIFLFVSLGVTAEDFFCPALTAISRTMKLNQSIAGVTFLAFGNGAPDIFSAIAAISNAKEGDAGLAIGALFGAGVFVTTVVAGSIAVTHPFKLAERPFLRDVVFYIGAAFWTFTILYRRQIVLAEAIGFIGLYVGYVLVVLIGRKVYEIQRKRQQSQPMRIPVGSPSINTEGGVSSNYGSVNDHDPHVNQESYMHSSTNHSVKGVLEASDQLAIAAAVGLPAPRRAPSVSQMGPQGDNSVDDGFMTPLLAGFARRYEEEQEEHSAIANLFIALNPVDSENWKRKSIFGKAYEIFKLPIQFMLQLTVPIVDYDEDRHGWNQLLNVLQCITGPMFCLGVTKAVSVHIHGNLYLWELMLPLCVILAIVIFITSKRDSHPVYHFLFPYLGFLVSVLWIYSIANEIVNLLQMFGVQFSLSTEVLGLTLLAWGNSIGDLVSDITVAKQGFPRMAIAACFGGPLFNMLLGIGISCTIAAIRNDGVFHVSFSQLQMVLAGGLGVSLLSSLFFMLCTRFNATRIYGFYLYALYLGFLVIALLTESKVIKW
ncbi:mitochondrial sodium/calcium exchanger protein-like [Amphiura filiformis]|uniref:mitochondrial sodium/calcium exchanger protein-like n=1 Tax=Amphiura filiformis TaxID=82378 RepID=UPI003B21BCF4